MLTYAMILAAGLGSRLKEMTAATPKPLLAINHKVMFDRCADKILALPGIKKVIVNVHYLADKMKEHIRTRRHADSFFVSEEQYMLGTGGGIAEVMKNFACKELLVHNSDIIIHHHYLNPLEQLMQHWEPGKMDALLLLAASQHIGIEWQRSSYDFALSRDGRIIREEALKKNRYVYTGVLILSYSFFQNVHTKKFALTDILFQASGTEYLSYRFYGMVLPQGSLWFDIGTTKNFAITNDCMAKLEGVI